MVFITLLYCSTPRKLRSFLTQLNCGWRGKLYTSSNMITVTYNHGKITRCKEAYKNNLREEPFTSRLFRLRVFLLEQTCSHIIVYRVSFTC